MTEDLFFDSSKQLADERTCAIALALTRNIGRKLIQRLQDTFGSLQDAVAASPDRLRTVPGIGPQIAASIRAIDILRVTEGLQRWQEQGITVAMWQDNIYPARLSALEDMPLVLFWKGAICVDDAQAVAIVGTREPKPGSIALAREWTAGFACCGWTVISGLARGIDSAAHEAALASEGRSIGVMGSGVNQVYPPENQPLALQLIERGALISEVPPDTAPSPNGLMRRNRIITALSRATLVIEAGATSGALHAARYAHGQGKQVFVVNNSDGNASLLGEFARLLPDKAKQVQRVIEKIAD